MQSPMIPSGISHLPHNTHSLKSKLDQEPQLNLLTPPQSSRSSFAQLPQTAVPSSHDPRWTPQVVSQGNSFIRFDQLNTPPGVDEDEYDDDTQTVMDEGEDEDEDAETDRGLDAPQFARLASVSMREPSPGGRLVLSTEDPEDFDVLDMNEARQTEEALVSLSGPISSTLTQYRSQFNQWGLWDNPPESVVHASIVIDQCLSKFVYTLEPLKWIAGDLFQLDCFLAQLSSFLAEHDLNDGHLSLESSTQLFNGFNRLADEITSVKDSLSDALNTITELCDWVDGTLTPALAEVKFPDAKANSHVSQILDVHSYLCESLFKACTILKIYVNCLHRIEWSISRFQSIILNCNNDNDAGSPFPIRQAFVWSSKWTASLTPIINSLGVFHTISNCIQAHSAGHFTSSSSDKDKIATCCHADSVIPFSQHPLTSFDVKPGLHNAASISYS